MHRGESKPSHADGNTKKSLLQQNGQRTDMLHKKLLTPTTSPRHLWAYTLKFTRDKNLTKIVLRVK